MDGDVMLILTEAEQKALAAAIESAAPLITEFCQPITGYSVTAEYRGKVADTFFVAKAP